MKKILLPFVLVLITGTAMAQTKKIAHRSHNGKNATMRINTTDNFGLSEKFNPADTAKKPLDTNATKKSGVKSKNTVSKKATKSKKQPVKKAEKTSK